MRNKPKMFGIRMDPEIKKKLRQLAKDEHRSMSKMVSYLVDWYDENRRNGNN